MALKLVFNPFLGTFDYVTDTSTLAAQVPMIIAAGSTFEVPAGQTGFVVPIANAGVIQIDAGGALVTS